MPKHDPVKDEIENLEKLLKFDLLDLNPSTADIQRWMFLKFKQLKEQLPSKTEHANIKIQQEETAQECNRRFAELSAEIDQLRRQVGASMNTPFSSSASSATSETTQAPPSPLLPSASHFFFESRDGLPIFKAGHKSSNGRSTIREVFDFLTQLEQEFELRNHELQRPTDNTDGWGRYAVMQLAEDPKKWAKFKWGPSPDISWKTFKSSVKNYYATEAAITQFDREYASLTSGSNILYFNTEFHEFWLLNQFLGRDMNEKTWIKQYVEKIANSGKPATALAQRTTTNRITATKPSTDLKEIMMFCETTYLNSRV